MKKARNLWHDLPQGGSRYGSVLTRLFLLLCLLATTQAGWADTTSSIGMGYSNSSSRWKNSSNDNITSQTTISSSSTPQTFTRSYTESGKTFNFSLTISDGKIADGNFQITKNTTGSSLTITAPSGVTITGLSIVPSSDGLAGTTASVGELSGSGTSYTWSGNSNSLTLNFVPSASKGIQFKNLTITYSTGGSSTKTDLAADDFKWSATSYTATIGGSNDFPTLTNKKSVSVTYESSNTDAATIASNGAITLKGAGKTTISAIFAGDDTYNAKTVSYELTVSAAAATVDAPTFNPASGTIAASTNNVTVTYPSGATLYTRWSGNSGTYSATDMIAEDFKNTTGATGSQTEGTRYLYAIAVKDGVNSAITEQEYTVTCKPTLALSSTSMSLNTSDNTSATSNITATNFKSESISHSNLTYTVSSNDENVATATVNQSTGVVTVTAVGAGTATITVGNTAGGVYLAADAVTISVTVAAAANVAPSITAQPTGATYTQNATATPLSVTATGTPTPTYQWYSNSTSSTTGASTISGATSASYTPSTSAVGTTYYYCVATNSEGTATSDIVGVTVNAAASTSTKWNFTTLTTDEITAMEGNTTTLTKDATNKYFKNKGWSNSYNFKDSSGNDLNVTEGLTFGKTGGSLSNGDIRYYYEAKKIYINSSNEYFQLPSQTAGTEITISWQAVSSKRTLTPSSNASLKSGSSAELSSNASGTSTFVVNEAGAVKFTVSGQVYLYSITTAAGSLTPPTFTTSPANNASGVAVDAAVTMTANNGTISMVGGTIAGTLKEGDATAAAAAFTLDGNVLTLTHSGNFKNNTTYEVTLNADQVSNTIGKNTATTFSFTTASPVLTVSNATGSSIPVSGGDVTLTKGVTGNSGEGTWTFVSSNTDVATVTDAGVVTPLTAGTTTITATYALDGQNYTKTYNMTVTAASASSTKWDFTTLTEDEITSMTENTKSLNKDTSNKYFKNKTWDKSGSQFYGGSNGNEVLNVCEGIVFDNRGNSISNGNIRFYYTEGNKRINLSNGYRMILPATVSSGKVRVTWSSTSSSSASLSPTNATYSGSGSATSKSTTPITSEFTVTAASPAFAAQNAAIYIYKVELGDSYDVAEPTLDPAKQDFASSSSLSVTINSTQTDGTVTHYYGFGTEKKTKEQLVSENKTVTSNNSVTPESGIENNLVLSVVTKVEKDGNTYYSDVVTGNYTYTGPRTGSLKLTDLHIQQGQRGLIFPSIVDASGNTILFGEDDASSVDLSKYFTFSYSKQSGGTSDENITVNLAEDKLNGDVYTKKDGNLAPVGATAVIKVTATPKDAALTYVHDQPIVGTVNVTVIAKVQGLDWATLWWDKEMTANQITVENGDYTVDTNESSTTKNYGIFTGTPNGRVIYVKPDVSKCDSICYFLQTKTDTKPTVSISYITMSSGNYHHYRHGIPIYIKDLTNGDTDANKTLWLSILGFKKTIVDGKETWIDAGSVMNMKFTLTAHALASNPVYAEETSVRQNTNRGTTVYTSDDGSTRNNTDINELYGKWSSKDNYTVTQMMTMPGTYVTYGVGSISVYSTEIGNRKLSAVQVAQTKENNEIFYYVSAVDNSHTYKFDIGTNLKFSQTDYTVNVTGTTGSNVDFTEPTVTGTYYDKGNKVTKEISYVTSGPTTTTSNLTYELIGAPTGVSIDASTGELTIDNGTITSQFRVKATYIGGQAIEEREGEESTSEPYTINGKGPGYTAPSSTEYTVNIVNPIEHVPSIQPATCNFSNTINVSISTPMSENGESYGVYYTIDGTDPTDGNGNYHGTYIKPDQNDVVTLGADLEIDKTVTVKAVAVGTPTTYESRIVSETYTKKKEVARPTFSPDGTSEPYYYYSSNKSLKVNISASDGATIYYTIGNPNVELISENLYEGLEGAVINGSGSIYAVAVKDGVRSSVAKSDYVYTTSIAAPVFVVEGNNYPTASTTSIEVTPETNIGLTAAQGNIYYTLDGSTPSENNGILYTGPFTTFHTITARAIAVDGEASSRVTTMTFTVPYDAEENDFWEAVEETTPGGVLAADKRVISMANNSPRAVKYLTAVFGGGLNEIYGNEPWSDRPINEASVGMPIDGVGTYSIRIDTEAKDELNVLYNHANAKGGVLNEKAPRSAKIPVQGNIVRFEPERTGALTIWALQEGALNYSNGKFCNAILSCRPVYLVDEQGQSIQPTLATSNSRLSANWDLLVSKENLLGKGQSQNGLTNNAYTQAQEQAIYDMFIDMLNGKGAGDNITNLKYIHNSEKQWNITDNVNDNTGYAIPSTGYVKYTFPVKANKTYYFFSPRGKIGIRGFRFVPESTEPTTLTITEDGTNADNINAAVGQTRKTSGFDRAYPENWTALTLPFSLSESQVRSIFGDEVSVLLFDRIEGTTIYLKRHYNQGIIAGVPVIIKGSNAVDATTSLNNLHVYVEETTAQNTTSEGYTYEGNFDPVDVNKYDYYMNSTGGISRWTGDATTYKPIKSLRAVLRNNNQSSAKLNMFMSTFMEEDEKNVLTGIQVIYDEVTGDINVIDNANIYNINGQLVRKNANSLEGLPKGIYIVNGKKVAVK